MIKQNLERVSRGRNEAVVFQPQTKPLRRVEPDVYQIEMPMMGPSFAYPSIRFGKASLEQESKSWDFNGSSEHATCIDDLHRFFSDEGEAFYRKVGVRWRRGIILWGPAGTGKTVIAKSMALEAMKLGVPVFYVRNYDAVEQVADSGLKCLVWIDEMDQLDDLTIAIDSLKDGVFIVGTTNHPERFEERIIKRPGRFDRVFNVVKMTPGMIRKLCSSYFIDAAFDEISKNFNTITPAQLAEISIRTNVYGLPLDVSVRSVKEEFGNK